MISFGNAVPVNLAYHIAMSIRAALDKHEVAYNTNDEDAIEKCRKRFGPLNIRVCKHNKVNYKELDLFESDNELFSIAREPEI